MNKEDVVLPPNMESEARDYMDAVLDMLIDNDVLTDVDTAALYMLATNFSTFVTATKLLDRDGCVIEKDSGPAAHPAIKIRNDAQVQAIKVMGEFGLTAKSRSTLPKLDADNTPLAAFITRQSRNQ